MNMESGEGKLETAVLLKEGTLVEIRVRDSTVKGNGRTSFVHVELREDLRLNLVKRNIPYLENCECWIPQIGASATSLNHAYTLISTEFETKRKAKGGNVFNNAFALTRSGELKALGTLRLLLLDKLSQDKKSRTANEEMPAKPGGDPGPIGATFNDVLYNEVQFVKLINELLDKCERAERQKELIRNAPVGTFFPFYCYVFGQFRLWLRGANLSELMGRWNFNANQFVQGSWSGYFLNEIESLVTQHRDFSKMVCDLARSKGSTTDLEPLQAWINKQT